MHQETFNKISEAYTRRRSRLLMEGRSQYPTSHGYWATSEPNQVHDLFKKIDLKRYKRFLDLGSGDGIVAAIASLFTDATGIEIDKDLHNTAAAIKKKLKLKHKLKNQDYMDEPLSQYDIIYINPDNYFHQLEKKLVEEFKGTLIIIDNIFMPLMLTPEKQVSVRGAGFSIYRLS